MGFNNTIGTKSNFALLPEIPVDQKLSASEVNEITGFQKSPVQKISNAFVDSDIIVDGTKEYSTTKVIAGATHTITASDDDAIADTLSSEHKQGNELRVRYQFDIDCTLTLTNFESTGNNTGNITPISAGTYDLKFKANARGVNVEIAQNTNVANFTEPNTWYVNTNGDDANVGSDKFPFETIGAAIAVYAAGDIIRIIDEGYSSNENITIDKKTTIIGPVANITGGGAFTQLQGTWTIDGAGISIIFENLTTKIDWDSSEVFNLDVINGAVGSASSFPTRLTELILHGSFYSLGASSELRSLACHSCIGVGSDVKIGRSLQLHATDHVGNITGGLDSSSTVTLKNSSITGDLTNTGSLNKTNSVVTGTEAVSGTTTDNNQLRKRSAPTIAANVLDIDFVDKFDFKTTAEVAATADFEITLSNDSNADIATIDLFITNTIIITLPSGSIMERFEVDDGRWAVGPVFELTIKGETGKSFELSLNKVGSKYKWVMSTIFE